MEEGLSTCEPIAESKLEQSSEGSPVDNIENGDSQDYVTGNSHICFYKT